MRHNNTMFLSATQAKQLVLPKINRVTAARINLFLDRVYHSGIEHSSTEYSHSLNVGRELVLNQHNPSFKVKLVGQTSNTHHKYNNAFISQQASPYDREDRTDFEFDLDFLMNNGCVAAVRQAIENELYLANHYIDRYSAYPGAARAIESAKDRLTFLTGLKSYLIEKYGGIIMTLPTNVKIEDMLTDDFIHSLTNSIIGTFMHNSSYRNKNFELAKKVAGEKLSRHLSEKLGVKPIK